LNLVKARHYNRNNAPAWIHNHVRNPYIWF
jgi:hypothetical protein